MGSFRHFLKVVKCLKAGLRVRCRCGGIRGLGDIFIKDYFLARIRLVLLLLGLGCWGS